MTLWLIFMACILFLSWVQQCLKVEEEEEWWGSRATSNAAAKGRFRRNHSTPFSALHPKSKSADGYSNPEYKTVRISEYCFKNPKPLSSFASQTNLSHPLQLIQLTS